MILGTIYKDGKVVNHRTLFKIILNPILRLFGFEIVSIFNGNDFVNYDIHKCKRTFVLWQRYEE